MRHDSVAEHRMGHSALGGASGKERSHSPIHVPAICLDVISLLSLDV